MYSKEFRIERINTWGNYYKVYGKVFRPERINDLTNFLNKNDSTFLPRGGGRSYGDASINTNGLNIDMTRLNKMLHFDEEAGSLLCQSGVTIGDIVGTFLPRGWLPYVTPGTQYSTVGGCIACDVHGKNWADGSFGNFITDFKVLLHDGRILRCNAFDSNPDLYFATLGGMGMTGIILDATIRLKKVRSAYFDVEYIRYDNLKELFSLLNEARQTYEYVFSWIDSQKHGKQMGRGVLQQGRHSSEGKLVHLQKRIIPVPFNFPSFVVNRFSVQAFNNLYFAKAGSRKIQKKTVHAVEFFYPLDSIAHWNRVYGKKGFLQYQVAFPPETAFDSVQEILKIISRSKIGSNVAALKPISASKGYISFPMNGYTLAIDILNIHKTQSILNELDQIVCDNGGKVYLAKDARLGASSFKKMYGNSLEKWETIRKKFGVNTSLSSHMFNRFYNS